MRRLPVLLLMALTAAALGYSDPFLPGLELGADSADVLAALEDAGWTVEDHFDRITERFIVRGKMEGRLLRYAYDFSERFEEAVYAEPHPPDETRTDAYRVWLDVLKETFGEPEVVDSFHHWKTGGYAVDIAAEEFDFGDGYTVPVVLVTIKKLP
ncbi:MAG TPA: hypothetical protein ENN88_00675 [Candidatus Coatesbacteria bacterium]|nr:hypothetical protein [Candidatus Coatesbacteria bacterium]